MLTTARRNSEPNDQVGQGLANFEYEVGQDLHGRDKNGEPYRPGMGKIVSIVGDPFKPSEITIQINLNRMGLRSLDLHYRQGLQLEGEVKFTPQVREDDLFILEGEMPCTGGPRPESYRTRSWGITLNEGKLWLS